MDNRHFQSLFQGNIICFIHVAASGTAGYQFIGSISEQGYVSSLLLMGRAFSFFNKTMLSAAADLQ